MLGVQENGIDLKCTEQSIPEFPNLLFGTTTDGSKTFFDATAYIFKTDPQKNIKDFFIRYGEAIESLCSAYKISANDICKINKSGHYLIDGNFAYLFIAFIDPHFLGYVFDRIHELFMRGFIVSDSYLLNESKRRIPKEVLLADADEETKDR